MNSRWDMELRRQGGVALITVMLVVTLVTVAAASMATRLNFDIRRTGNLLQIDQAALHIDSFEAYAAVLLARNYDDFKPLTAGDIDQFNTIGFTFEIDNGMMRGTAADLQGRFNLNSLPGDAEAQAQFRRLITLLKADPDHGEALQAILADELTNAVIDWVDSPDDYENGSEPMLPGGAEDDFYLGQEQPYRTANGIMGDISELRLIRGVSEAVYEVLAPYLCTLPEPTRINVNTASREVLMSLADKIDETRADGLISEREGDSPDSNGFASVEKFLQSDQLAGIAISEEQKARLTVESNYYQINTEVAVGEITLRFASLINRKNTGETAVIGRIRETL